MDSLGFFRLGFESKDPASHILHDYINPTYTNIEEYKSHSWSIGNVGGLSIKPGHDENSGSEGSSSLPPKHYKAGAV